MNSQNDLMECKYDNCEKFFELPINLPCGETICQHHVTEKIASSDNKDIFECTFCNEQHLIPKDGFALNRALIKIINLNIHLNGNHKLAKKELDKLESFLNEQSRVNPDARQDAENFLFEYFFTIRNQIDLHREKLIKDIHDASDRILDKLNEYEKECKNNISQAKHLNFDELKNDLLPKFKEELRFPNIKTDQLNNILVDIKSSKIKIESLISDYKKDLLMNKDYEFMPIKLTESIFGDLYVKEINDNSNNKMLSDEYGKCLMSFQGHTGSISAVTFLKEKDLLISGSFDCSIKIWSINTGECLATLNSHSKPITDLLALSNNYFISSSLDNSIILWNSDSNSKLKSYMPVVKNSVCPNVSSIILINNNEFACGFNYGHLCLINICNLDIKISNHVHKDRINKIKLISNSRLLTCSNDKEIKIIDSKTLNVINTLNHHLNSVNCLELAVNNYFLSGSFDGTIKIWSLSDNQNNAECILTIPMGIKISDIKLIDLNKLAIATFNNTKNLVIYDYAKNLVSNELNGHSSCVFKLEYSQSICKFNKLFSCSADFSIKMWNV
jgi:WD40 repeat protein